jgi:hypothetical protein
MQLMLNDLYQVQQEMLHLLTINYNKNSNNNDCIIYNNSNNSKYLASKKFVIIDGVANDIN